MSKFVKIIKICDVNSVWYNKHIGEIFEVVPYRFNAANYYERVDRKAIMDKNRDNLSNIPNDYWLMVRDCIEVEGPRYFKAEIDKILEL